MNWEDAEMKLKGKPDGSFLVRDSSDPRYILSLSFRSQGITHHTRMEHYRGESRGRCWGCRWQRWPGAGDQSDPKVPEQRCGHRADGRGGAAAAVCPDSCAELLQETFAFDFASGSDSPYTSEKLGNAGIPCACPLALL